MFPTYMGTKMIVLEILSTDFFVVLKVLTYIILRDSDKPDQTLTIF
jgi:hypothetical protein